MIPWRRQIKPVKRLFFWVGCAKWVCNHQPLVHATSWASIAITGTMISPWQVLTNHQTICFFMPAAATAYPPMAKVLVPPSLEDEVPAQGEPSWRFLVGFVEVNNQYEHEVRYDGWGLMIDDGWWWMMIGDWWWMTKMMIKRWWSMSVHDGWWWLVVICSCTCFSLITTINHDYVGLHTINLWGGLVINTLHVSNYMQ